MSVVFGYHKSSIALADIVKSVKATIGVKFGTTHIGTIEPNLYSSIEPKDASAIQEPKKNIDIDMYKKTIQSFLQQHGIYLFILVDKVDEFVIKGDYDAQRLVLQALLETEKGYMDYKNIKFKLFIRCDLYKRLEYDTLGSDKVQAKKIDLLWREDDIRKLIAQRIIYNYFKVFNLQSLSFEIDNDKLYIDEMSVDPERQSSATDMKRDTLSRIFDYCGKFFKRRISRHLKRLVEGRRTALNDEINKQIITSLFPRLIKHKDKEDNLKEIDIFEYFNTHFSLASGTTTPRLIIMFLDKCLSIAKEYYRNNADEKLLLDIHNEYPLFKRKIIYDAYTEFQKEVIDSFSDVSKSWNGLFNKFISIKDNRDRFSSEEIYFMLGVDPDEVRRFVAFMCHIGYLKCENPRDIHNNRMYTIPILFRKT